METFGKFCPHLVYRSRIHFKRNYSHGLLRWSNIQIKDGTRRSEFHFVWLENSFTTSMSTVWPSFNREGDRYCVWFFYNLFSLSVALWLTRRWRFYDGTCPNLFRGDRVLILVHSDCLSEGPSDLEPEIAFSLGEAQATLTDFIIYFDKIFFIN